ncbi:NUP116 [Acrasis kona]|uniref:NUP116 n=1 Tax=Acrasis kona TaxID=1008807 RepID=A0AAW2ZNW5_9EUKA
MTRKKKALFSSPTSTPSSSGETSTTAPNTKPPFRVTYEKDPYNYTNWEYHSITKMPEYQEYSFEQLRWEDYQASKKFDSDDKPDQAVDPESNNQGAPPPTQNNQPTSLPKSQETSPLSFVLFGGEDEEQTVKLKEKVDPVLKSLSDDFSLLLPEDKEDNDESNNFANATSDIVLRSADGNNHSAHKLILACRSKRLRQTFFPSDPLSPNNTSIPDASWNSNTLYFKNHRSPIIQKLLAWIYSGKSWLNDTQCDLVQSMQTSKDMYEISRDLDIHVLMNTCLLHIKSNVAKSNIAQTWKWAHEQQAILHSFEEAHPVLELLDALLFSIEGKFFSALHDLSEEHSSYQVWDEKFVLETFIPTTETWLVTNMMNTSLSNSIGILLLSWAGSVYKDQSDTAKRQFLQKLITFKAIRLPEEWRTALKDMISSESMITVEGICKLFEMLLK